MEEEQKPTLCLFEDDRYTNFLPLALNRPIFDLFLGTQTLGRRIITEIGPEKIVLLCRAYLAGVVRENAADNEGGPVVLVNDTVDEDTIFINGRLLAYGKELGELIALLDREKILHKKGVPVAARLVGPHAVSFIERLTDSFDDGAVIKDFQAIRDVSSKQEARVSKREGMREPIEEGWVISWAGEQEVEIAETGSKLLSYYWQLIEENSNCIRDDFEKNPLRGSSPDSALFKGVDLIKEEDIVIGAEVEVRSGTVLDASEGPIVIDDGASIEPNAIINGPCYVGKRSIIRGGAKIGHGTSIGIECRIGGEVEESIISPYTNKQHEGFLGHSYIGSWVNIGAGSCNSDLKNNYSPVKAWCVGRMKDTGRTFLGVIIADHSKIAINTGLNTGTVIGFNANVLLSCFPPKFVPSFTWELEPELVEFELDRALKTAQIMMDRRNVTCSEKMAELFRTIHRFCKQSGRTI
jgi:UDP-N-acetylglucosamine diphosphorylase/glucosamine-1-phosphate N-acetyltransferase